MPTHRTTDVILNTLTKLRESVGERFDRVDARFDKVDQRLSDLDHKLKRIEALIHLDDDW
jgi:hypothetical protein